jgi:hypothetical protein
LDIIEFIKPMCKEICFPDFDHKKTYPFGYILSRVSI